MKLYKASITFKQYFQCDDEVDEDLLAKEAISERMDDCGLGGLEVQLIKDQTHVDEDDMERLIYDENDGLTDTTVRDWFNPKVIPTDQIKDGAVIEVGGHKYKLKKVKEKGKG